MCAEPAINRSREAWLLVVAMVLPTLAAWAYFHQWAGTPAMMPIYTAGKLVQFALPIVWAWLYAWRWPRGVLAPRGLVLALGFGALAATGIVAGYLLWLSDDPLWQSAAARMTGRMAQAGFADPRWFLLLAVFYSLAHSGLEEYYWRWFVFGRLQERLRPALAIALASLAFASHHALIVAAFFPGELSLILALSAGVGGGGAVWCWLYRSSGSLLGPWLSHALIDAALMFVGYLMLGAGRS